MRSITCFFRSGSALALAATAAAVSGLIAWSSPAGADAVSPTTPCAAPSDLVRLDVPLRRAAQKIAGGLPLTIVAIGSSSTAGAGASSPAMNYPNRLAAELRILYPRLEINVINRGVNGETAKEMLARFDEQVIADKPDIVIWQVGSNSVLRDQPVADAGALIRQGVRSLKEAGADVILMNPQYAPKVIVKREIDEMVDFISTLAKETNVDLFQRFAVMRYWRLTEDIPFDTFVSPDQVHMNDWSYGCVAKLLAGAISEAATRPTMTAGAGAAR